MKRIFKSLIGFCLVLMLLPALAFAGVSDVTLAWDANNTEPDLMGYRLYQATTSGGHVIGTGDEVDTISAGIQEVTLYDLPDGEYFWVLTAYDTEDRESEPSNEVTIVLDTITGLPPIAPQGFRVKSIDVH